MASRLTCLRPVFEIFSKVKIFWKHEWPPYFWLTINMQNVAYFCLYSKRPMSKKGHIFITLVYLLTQNVYLHLWQCEIYILEHMYSTHHLPMSVLSGWECASMSSALLLQVCVFLCFRCSDGIDRHRQEWLDYGCSEVWAADSVAQRWCSISTVIYFTQHPPYRPQKAHVRTTPPGAQTLQQGPSALLASSPRPPRRWELILQWLKASLASPTGLLIVAILDWAIGMEWDQCKTYESTDP